MTEIKPIPGFPGYKIDKNGNVYGTKNQLMRTRQHRRKRGYLIVDLLVRKVPFKRVMRVTKKVHSLVLETFVSPRPSPKHQVRHLDGNPANNNLENLCWGTAKENSEDKKRHGTYRKSITKSKFNGQIEIIKSLRFEEKLTLAEIAERYETSGSHISKILRGICWGEI